MYPFGSIGKTNLVPAIGLSVNRSSEIDRKASGCFSCPHYAAMLKGKGSSDHCSSCDKKRRTYQNEKSRYGHKEALTKSELFVFIDLHLYSPSSTGVVSNVSAKDIASDCHIAIKTAYVSLNSLESKGYICIDKSIRGSYTLILTDYEKYFAPAGRGGRGYVIFTREFFNQLLSIRDGINAIRYAIRSYINIDLDAKTNPSHALIHSESVQQALSYLPRYLRPCHIRNFISTSLSTMFSPLKTFGQEIVLRLDPSYYGPTVKENMIGEECNEFRVQLEDVIDALHKHEKGFVSVFHLSDLARSAHVALVRLRANTGNSLLTPETLIKTDSDFLLSMAQISVEYGHDRVLQSLKQVWMDWKPGSKDQASYLRTILT